MTRNGSVRKKGSASPQARTLLFLEPRLRLKDSQNKNNQPGVYTFRRTHGALRGIPQIPRFSAATLLLFRSRKRRLTMKAPPRVVQTFSLRASLADSWIPGSLASTARAMSTMGTERSWLVRCRMR